MMTRTERNRFVAGSLLIAASLAIGAATGEWTPGAERDAPILDAPTLDAPVLDGFDAAPPAARFVDEILAEGERTDAHQASEAPAAETASDAPVDEALLVLEGSASWYADALAGHRTASGEPYDPSELIAAHRALPFGTRLRVTNLSNDRSVEVRVIDRGPFIAGRILDLSRSAAEQIGMIRAGHARVKVEILEYPSTSLN